MSDLLGDKSVISLGWRLYGMLGLCMSFAPVEAGDVVFNHGV